MAELRPIPPGGYVPFKERRGDSPSICAACGGKGLVWKGGGYQDPKLVERLDKMYARVGQSLFFHKKKGHFEHLEWLKYEGKRFLDHWSRYGEGYCDRCGAKYWHDFIGYPWHYYMKADGADIKPGVDAQLTMPF